MKREHLLAVIGDHARPLVRQYYRSDSCIASAWIVCATLRHFGFNAKPMGVHCEVFNAEYIRALAIGARPPNADEPPEQITAWFEKHGAHSISLGALTPGAPTWATEAAHVVVLSGAYLIDTSVDQASRPAKGIDLPPAIFARMPVEWAKGGVWQIMPMPGGGMIRYRAHPNEHGWVKSVSWQDDGYDRRVRDKIVSTLVEIAKNKRGRK